jgi:hypothetical protein
VKVLVGGTIIGVMLARPDQLHLVASRAQPFDEPGDSGSNAIDLGRIGLGDEGDAQRPARRRKVVDDDRWLGGFDHAAMLTGFGDTTMTCARCLIPDTIASSFINARQSPSRHAGLVQRSRSIRQGDTVKEFLRALQIQRWDDHRYYHHSRINQSLHLVSAVSFLTAYAFLFTDPVMAALIGWLVSMTSRQAGHFFFEPKGYDEVNQATHEYKEEIKVGYNLRRKVVLMSLWAASPLLLLAEPTLFGLIEPSESFGEFAHNVGAMWLALGVGGLVFRTVQLFLLKDVQTGLVWMTKILTDPFHDIKLYYRAPLQLLRGELTDSNVAPQNR